MFEGFEEISDKDFYRKAIASEVPAVVLFVDPNSEKTEEFLSILKPYAEKYRNQVNFFFLDVTKNASQKDFGIFNFPSAIYFRDTMEIDRHDFIPTADMVEEAMKRLLKLKS